MADDEPMEEAPADAPAEGEVEVAEMSVLDALRDVLKRALIHGGLKRGLGGEQPSQAVGPRGAEATVHAEQGGSHGVLQVRKLSGWLWVPRLEEPVRCLKCTVAHIQ